MSNIRPVSDLRNYNDVLDACREDSPVYLTEKGKVKIIRIIDSRHEYMNILFGDS